MVEINLFSVSGGVKIYVWGGDSFSFKSLITLALLFSVVFANKPLLKSPHNETYINRKHLEMA